RDADRRALECAVRLRPRAHAAAGSWFFHSCVKRASTAFGPITIEGDRHMTTNRLALGVATSVLVLGVGAGVYATAQNTNQDPRSFSRGIGPGGPGGRGEPFDSAQGRRGGPGGPMGMLP